MRILVIGGDKRMDYAAGFMPQKYEVERVTENASPNERFDVILLPLPLTKNGKDISGAAPLPFEVIENYAVENKTLILAGGECTALTELCNKHGYSLENYFARESLTLKNAALTAESAAAMLAQSTDGALLDSSVLIIGYGRIASYLAARLNAFGCSVTIAARREEQRTTARLDGYNAVTIEHALNSAREFDYIANTVPAVLFIEEKFREIADHSVYMELASLPNAEKLAEECGARYIFAGGLPGKYSPKAAGKYIAEEAISLIKSYTAQRRDQ